MEEEKAFEFENKCGESRETQEIAVEISEGVLDLVEVEEGRRVE